MKIDFENLPINPNQSRAARNYLGLSQPQTAEKSGLPLYKIKRYESGNYIPDTQFVQALREFYEGQGYDFSDEDSPGAKARARGDIVPGGVLGKPTASPAELTVSSGKPELVNLQFMRINPHLTEEQIDAILERVDTNEAQLSEVLGQPNRRGFLSSYPSIEAQLQMVGWIRLLAENGLLTAYLFGREPLPFSESGEAVPIERASTVGELLQASFQTYWNATVLADAAAAAKLREQRKQPTELIEALFAA